MIAAVVAALAAVGSASGANPTSQQIYTDLADNGRLDGNYTAQELKAALNDPSVQGYGKPSVVVGIKPAVEEQLAQPTQGVLGATQSKPLGAAGQAGRLPFTGLDVALLAAGGLALLALGTGLRWLGRAKG